MPDFLLNPAITFLNHGSFGATPRPVFEAYQRWQAELEQQPVEFLGRRITSLLAESRAALGAFLNAPADDLVFYPNPTTALNMVIKSLALHPGDEILTTDHEYGALDRTWTFVCERSGARYIHMPIPLPVTTAADFTERIWSQVTPRTRVLFLSHLTSPTALIFPIAELVQRARQLGILTIIDGAHVPGHLPLDLTALNADVYVGALHKWLCAPKGAAFLYARRDLQPHLHPLVVSWGWRPDPGWPTVTPFVDENEWQGTRDYSAFLTVPTALDFHRQHIAPHQPDCRALARSAAAEINSLTGLPPIAPLSDDWLGQMAAVRLSAGTDTARLKQRLYDEFQIEVPLVVWSGQPLLRLSVQVYNTPADIERLLEALRALL